MSIADIVENLESQVINIEDLTNVQSDERDKIIERLNGIIDDLENLDDTESDECGDDEEPYDEGIED